MHATLLDELGYGHHPPNALQRVVQAFATRPVGAWALAHALPRLDRVVLRLTAGRHSVASSFAGLPPLELITTGSRTGQPRTALVLGVPFGDDVAVAGANFAQRRQPGWVANLLAHPTAQLGYRGRRVSVAARPATADEFPTIVALSAGVYRGSSAYVRRITTRPLRVFVLSRVEREPRP